MLARQGKTQEALQIGSPNIPEWRSYDLLLACLARKPSSEIATLAGSVRASDDPELNYFAAAHLAYCDQTEAAVDLLRRAIKGNYCSYPAMESDPLFAKVRIYVPVTPTCARPVVRVRSALSRGEIG